MALLAIALLAMVSSAICLSAQQEQPPVESDADLREMCVRILDDNGQPLEGAKLRISVWYAEGYDGPRAPKEYVADSSGTVVLRLPRRLKILRLWPQQEGYVSEFMNFAMGAHREGELIPYEFEFRLSKGRPIGGRVVDEQGEPIADVHVRVRVDDREPAWTVDTRPMVSSRLTDSFFQPVIKTDEEGRWRLNNAPAPRGEGADYKFRLKLSHDDFIDDAQWGETQRSQGVVTADLRRGDATLVLGRGATVSGRVTDLGGSPVTEGWVVWNDEPYLSDGVFETEIGPDGGFRTPPLAEGDHPITIVAPGFAAQRRVVRLNGEPLDLRFELRPGKRLEIRFVDASGEPIPGAGVYLANSSDPNTWQGSNALHNHKHPNVPDYGIERRADESGVYVWDWAPEEPVRCSVGAKGFASQEVTLIAKSEPHTITLAASRVVEGTVTNATTGEPIEAFQAMPVIVFRSDFFSTRFTDTKLGSAGRYELPLTGSGDPDDRYRVRFEAEGYRSVVSEESYGPTDGRAELNVQLEPAPMRRGRAIDSEGEPVAGAMVLEGTPTWVPRIYNGKPESYGERIVRTDSEGRFRLNATTEPVRVRVLHENGIAEKLLDPADESVGDMPLRPWASVSGRLLQDGQPVGDQSIYFGPLVSRGLGEARFQDSYSSSTDADGRFEMNRLPPTHGSLRAYLGPWRESPLTSSKSLALDLKPGEHRQVVLGGEGATLTGRVVATGRDEAPLDRKWSLSYLVSRDRGIPLSKLSEPPSFGFDPSGPFKLSWLRDPNWTTWLGTREHHFVKLSSEGDVRVSGVAAGDYDLVLRLYEQPAGCLVETVGEKVVPITVGETQRLDLGDIEVPCRAGPRPGSDMRAYQFVDATGQGRAINDMVGRRVLMHVWASWCAPCLAHMPEIADLHDRTPEDSLVLVGLNVDADLDRARALVDRRGWRWAQNYLGDDSDFARQLALSTVPSYYLIGPDGRLVAASTDWREIRELATDTVR